MAVRRMVAAVSASVASGAAGATSQATEAAPSGWRWVRNPELWIALVIGAFLRLWALDVTPIGYDQVLQVQLAREALARGAIPIAGLPASVGLQGSPLGVWITLPFVAMGRSPLPVAASIALVNVLGIAACYIFTLRCFGRRTAALATLLFATCAAAVDSSRVIWLPNYVPAVLAFWALALEAGVRRQRPGWLISGVVLFVAAFLLHPAAILVLPALLVALVLAPRRLRDVFGTLVVLLLLALPNVIWEALSGGGDIRTLGHYAAGRSTVNLEVIYRVYELFGGPQSALQPERASSGLRWMLDLILHTPTRTIFTASAPYNALAPLYFPLAVCATALFGVGWLVLSARVLGPVRGQWRAAEADTAAELNGTGRASRRSLRGGPARGLATWRALHTDPQWRMWLLLWVLVTLPPALTLRHNGPIQPHYLLCLYPFCFIVAGMGGIWLFEAAGRVRLGRLPVAPGARRPSVGSLVVTAALALLLAGQVAQSLLATMSLSAGAFDLGPHPISYTLASLQSADAALGRLTRQQGARTVVVLTTLTTQSPLTYSLAGDHADRTSVDEGCLIVPGPADQPALIVSSDPRHGAAHLLAVLPNSRQVGSVPLAGSDPLAVYRIQGVVPPLPDERAITPAAFQDGRSDDGLRLDAVALAPPNGLRLRWTVLGTTPLGATPMGQRVTIALHDPGGQTLAAGWTECNPTAWHAGDTVFTWQGFASLPGGATLAKLVPTLSPSSESLLISMLRFSSTLDVRSIGPIHCISGWPVPVRYTALAAQPAAPPSAPSEAAVGVSAAGVTLTSADFASA